MRSAALAINVCSRSHLSWSCHSVVYVPSERQLHAPPHPTPPSVVLFMMAFPYTHTGFKQTQHKYHLIHQHYSSSLEHPKQKSRLNTLSIHILHKSFNMQPWILHKLLFSIANKLQHDALIWAQNAFNISDLNKNILKCIEMVFLPFFSPVFFVKNKCRT